MASNQPLFQQAAWASIVAPFITVAIVAWFNLSAGATPRDERPDRAAGMVVGVAGLVITCVGLVCAVIGIVGAVRQRPIFLLPSLIGLLLNGGYVFLVIYSLLYVMQLVNQGTLRPS